MIKITTDLQNTIRVNRHIEKVYFDQLGDFYFNAHELNGKAYHRIRKQVVTDRAKVNAKPETVTEAKAEHELVDVLSREEVLAAKPENEIPLTAEAQSVFDALQKELKEAKEQIEKLSKGEKKEAKPKEEKIKA